MQEHKRCLYFLTQRRTEYIKYFTVYSKQQLITVISRLEQVQALADISCSALCCHSNETRAPIANPPNNAQLQGAPYYSPQVSSGFV